MNFDEANIFIHSVHRGLRKVCRTPAFSDKLLADVCRQMFDAHNLPYSKMITREQVKRWLRNDVEANSYLDAFHESYSLPELDNFMAEMEQAQDLAFVALPGGDRGDDATVSADELSRSAMLRKALGNPSEAALQDLIDALSGQRKAPVGRERFADVVRAWNVFCAVDAASSGEVNAKELRLLLWLWSREEPSAAEMETQREKLGLPSDLAEGKIKLAAWLAVILGGPMPAWS